MKSKDPGFAPQPVQPFKKQQRDVILQDRENQRSQSYDFGIYNYNAGVVCTV
jgi:hypothetical protein